ncbi:ribonuclease H2 subunit B-like [Mytilus edulis]|uniref:ribonuclease H2 subunit B-like n=1 Tax=Mytilus edulis TaxID=6550 RepID=UPI0039EEA3CA
MPPRRSSRANPSKENTTEQKSKCNGITEKEPDQWVMLINSTTLQTNQDPEENPKFYQLKHPKTEKGALFLFSGNDTDVYELQSFNQQFRSWIIDNKILKDGKILFTTPIDPLFLVLPYLQKEEKSGKFMTLDQIVADDSFPECRRLCNTSGMSLLKEISDVKGDDSFKAYRFNKEKTLSWLKEKANRLADKMTEKDICVSGSSHSVNFIKSKKSSVTSREDFVRFAHGVVSDFISEDLSIALRDYMGIPVIIPKKEIENEEPPAKKQKTGSSAPTDDYSKEQSKPKAQTEKKVSTAQKKLSQVDKSGMKSLSSFFSPKPKK